MFGFVALAPLFLVLHPYPHTFMASGSAAADDTSSSTYFPREARAVPQSEVVHIQFKRISYPLTDRPSEVWIVETNQDGHTQWRTLESFLCTLHLTSSDDSSRSNGDNIIPRETQQPAASLWVTPPLSSLTASTLPEPPSATTTTLIAPLPRRRTFRRPTTSSSSGMDISSSDANL